MGNIIGTYTRYIINIVTVMLPMIFGYSLIAPYHSSLAGETLMQGGESLVKFPLVFCVAYSATVGHIMRGFLLYTTPHALSSVPKQATACLFHNQHAKKFLA